MENFFENINDVKELKREYIRLMMRFHPDNYPESGQTIAILSDALEIDRQYEERFEHLKTVNERKGITKSSDDYYWNFDDEFRLAVGLLGACSCVIEMELCGCFLWLKAEKLCERKIMELQEYFLVGYAPQKELYFVCLNDQYMPAPNGEMSMKYIRDRYGTTNL